MSGCTIGRSMARSTLNEQEDWEDEEDFEDDEGDDYGGDNDDDEVETTECPYCGRSVYEQAEQCPHCGWYISSEDGPAPRRFPVWIIWTALILAGSFLYFAFRGF